MHSILMKSGDEGNVLGCGDIHHARVLAGLSLRRTLSGGEMDQVITWNHNVSISSLNHFMSNEDRTSDKSHIPKHALTEMSAWYSPHIYRTSRGS